jgi:hypothetical protein
MTELNTSKPKAHHYIPQFYLGGFTDPSSPNWVWVYQRGTSSPRKQRPRSIGFRNHYHTFTDADGHRDQETLERLFGLIEGNAAAITRKFLDYRLPTPEDKARYSEFLALMMLRTPAFREALEYGMGSLLKQANQMIARSPALWSAACDWMEQNPEILQGDDPDELRALLQADDYEVKMSEEFSLQVIGHIAGAADLFSQMNWHLVEAPTGAEFWTSDNPVSIAVDGKYSAYVNALASPDCEVAFPITARMALVAMWVDRPDRCVAAPPAVVDVMNGRTVETAYREVYAATKSHEILRTVNEKLGTALSLQPSR